MKARALVAIPVLAVLGLTGCGGSTSDASPATTVGASGTDALGGTLTVFAAASLTDVFTELGNRFTAEHPALYRIIRQAEFASPETLQFHYDRIVEGYVGALGRAMDAGEVERRDPEVLAWSLMGIGELIGMRYILWAKRDDVSEHVLDEIERVIACILDPREAR